MQVTVETFQKWANALLETVSDKEGIGHKVHILHALFRVMWYISDAGDFPGDIILEIQN